MPYMSDVMNLLEKSFEKLKYLDKLVTDDLTFPEIEEAGKNLDEMIKSMEIMLKEYKALQIGHGGRVQ